MKIDKNNVKIAVVGLGYVGLPLVVEFSKVFSNVYGFDINKTRVEQLKKFDDVTKEVENIELKKLKNLIFTSNIDEISDCNIYIVTVPTPIDKNKNPNLEPLKTASSMIASKLKKKDIVIYESTVYPGCTEEICVPILEKSGLKFNADFFCGYSPERINPGDKINTLVTIKKVTSGSNSKVAKFVDELYSKIIKAGTYLASSIKVAEASKAIENAQRDLNISFVNELALIFDRIGIDTLEVLNAANTKWNFLNFKPGLVGGHCISVDPYYLVHKAESLGYYPEVILSGRRVNDNMPNFVASKLVKLLISNGKNVKDSSALILGVTFKGNCPDIRNSKVADVYRELIDFGIDTHVYDPHASVKEVFNEFKIDLISTIDGSIKYDAIILAVDHLIFKNLDIKKLKRTKNSVVYDLKGFLDKNFVTARL